METTKINFVEFPHLMKEWHPTKNFAKSLSEYPDGIYTYVWWQCENGHEWQSSIRNRAQRGHNCPYCTNHRLLVGYNDLATIRPELAAEWHPTKNGDVLPTDILGGARFRAWWRCENGHEWQVSVGNRVHRHTRCPYCVGVRVEEKKITYSPEAKPARARTGEKTIKQPSAPKTDFAYGYLGWTDFEIHCVAAYEQYEHDKLVDDLTRTYYHEEY